MTAAMVVTGICVMGEGVSLLSTVSAGFDSAGMGTVCHRPLVSDDGRVSFLASADKMPPVFGVLRSYLYDGRSSALIFPESSNSWQVVGDKGLRSFGGILFQAVSKGISLSWTDRLGEERSKVWLNDMPMHSGLRHQDLQVSYASDSGLFIVNGGTYPCVPATLHEGNLVLQPSLVGLHSPSSYGTAISSDGRFLYYSSETSPASGTPGFISEGLLSIYRYDVEFQSSLFIGQSGLPSLDPELSCSSDGGVVSYVCRVHAVTDAYETAQIVMQTVSQQGAVSQPSVISRWEGSSAESISGGSSKAGPCQSPFVSGDGQFIVFSARSMNLPGGGTGSLEQVYRYGVQGGDLEQVSVGLSGACVVPSVSPNGRLVTFVHVEDPKSRSSVMLGDCGPSLSLPAVSSGGQGGFELGIVTSARGEFKLELPAGTSVLGHVEDAEGTWVTLGRWYDMSHLPVRYVSESAESFELTVTVREGAWETRGVMGVLVTIPWSLESVSGSGHYSGLEVSYGNLGLSEDGNVVLFSMDDDLLHDLGMENRHRQNLYVRRHRNGVLQTERLTGDQRPFKNLLGKAALSGDGKVAWFANGNQLVRLVLDGDSKTMATVSELSALATDYTGKVAAWLAGGAVTYCDGESVRSLCADGAQGGLLSRDGRTVVYAVGDSLWGWTVGMSEPMLLKSGLTEVRLSGLSLSGHEVYYTVGGKLYGLSFGAGTEPISLGNFSGCESVRVSGSGTTALFSRAVSGVSQLYVRRLGPVSAADILVSSPNGQTLGNASSDSQRAPACMSVDGHMVAFISQASNLVSGDANGVQDLFVWKDLTFSQVSPEMSVAVQAGREDERLEGTIVPVSRSGRQVMVSLVSGISEAGGTVELLPPSVSRKGYGLLVTPKANVCGADTVSLRAYDGSETVTFKVGLQVDEVNDPPTWSAESYDLTVNENEEVRWSMAGKGLDVDLHNPPAYRDALRFAVSREPGLTLTVQGDVLILRASYEVANRQDPEKTFALQLTVTDRAGAQATSTLQLTVCNTNRAPVARTRQLELREGEAFALPRTSFLDADGDELRYGFQLDEGMLRDASGRVIRSGQTTDASQWPVTYEADPASVNEASFGLWAVDGSNARSETVTVKVVLKRQTSSVSELWGGHTDASGKVCWDGLQEGWNLLSVPMELKGEDYAAFMAWLKPVAIWRWSTEHRRYELGKDLKAREGFWAYLKELPALTGVLCGSAGEPWSGAGWQLVMPSASSGKAFSYDGKAKALFKGKSDKPGQGVWRYGNGATKR